VVDTLRDLLVSCCRRLAPQRSSVRPVGRAVRAAFSRLAVLVLLGFHTWLFYTEFGDGRLADPAVAFRWVWGGLILAGFLAIRRVGIPQLFSRKAIVLWLFVILLHCQAVASRPGASFDAATLPERFSAVAAPFALGPAGVALGFLLLALLARRQSAQTRALQRFVPVASPVGTTFAGYVPPFASRPPPA
jgi:hypothetical protein